MKITLILLQSLDGIIATSPDDKLDWGTSEDKLFFKKITEKIGFMIMGSTTYTTLPQKIFKTRKALVFALDPAKLTPNPQVQFFKGTVYEGVKLLESSGINEAALIGGANLIAQFLSAGLVDELYLTIAPLVFSQGLRGFGGISRTIKLQLLGTGTTGSNEIVLHYRVT